MINSVSNILVIIGNYIDLTKRKRNYFGLCPFHNEKTPSFAVMPYRNIFHCFGCGVEGDSNDFLNNVHGRTN